MAETVAEPIPAKARLQKLVSTDGFAELPSDKRMELGARVFKETIGSSKDFKGLNQDVQKEVFQRFITQDEFTKEFRPGEQPIEDMMDQADPEPQSPLKKAAIWAVKNHPVLQAFNLASEGFQREEAMVASPILAAMRGEDISDSFVEAMQGKSVDRHGEEHAELGDVLSEMGAPEWLSTWGGFAAQFALPSTYVGGMVGKAVKGRGAFTALTKGEQASVAATRKTLDKLQDLYKIGDRSAIFRAHGEAVDSGLFPNWKKIFDKNLDDVGKENHSANRFQEFYAKQRRMAGQGRLGKRTAKKRFQEAHPRLGKKLEQGRFYARTQQETLHEARQRTVKNMLDEYAPLDDVKLYDKVVELPGGAGALLPRTLNSNSAAGYSMQAEDIVRQSLGVAEGADKDVGWLGKILSGIGLPEEVLSRNPLGRGIWKLAVLAEDRKNWLSRSLYRKKNAIDKAIPLDELGENQLGFMLHAVDDIKKLPTSPIEQMRFLKEGFKKQFPKVGDDYVDKLMGQVFPNGVAPDGVITKHKMLRRLLERTRVISGIGPDNTVIGYLTKFYRKASSQANFKGDVTPDKLNDARVALLNQLREDLNVDAGTHKYLMESMEGFGLKGGGLSRGTVQKLRFPGAVPKRKMFGPLDFKRTVPADQASAEALLDSLDMNAGKVLDSYLQGAIRKSSLDQFLPRAGELLQAIQRNVPNSDLSEYASKYIDAFRGVPQGVGGKTLRKMAAFEGWRQYVSKIGLRPFAAFINLTQTPINTYPKLLADHGFKGGTEAFFAGIFEYFSKTGQRRLVGSGVGLGTPGKVGDIKSHHRLMDQLASKMGFMFDKVEEANRGIAFLAGRHASLAKGSSISRANEAGKMLSNATNFIMGKSNRPLAFQTPIGSVAGRFKVFTLNQIKFIKDGFKNSPLVQIPAMIGMMEILGGPDALTLGPLGGMDKVRAQLNEDLPDHPFTKALNSFQRRSLAGSLGIDLSGGKLAIPLIQELQVFTRPGATNQFKDVMFGLMGPTASDLTNIVDTMNKASLVGVSDQTMDNIMKLASRATIDWREFNDVMSKGELRDSKGNFFAKVPKEDAVKFLLGFETPEVAKQRRIYSQLMETDSKAKAITKEYMERITNGDIEGAEKIRRRGVVIDGTRYPIVVDTGSMLRYSFNKMANPVERRFKGSGKVAKFAHGKEVFGFLREAKSTES